jgi:hypothetical protein
MLFEKVQPGSCTPAAVDFWSLGVGSLIAALRRKVSRRPKKSQYGRGGNSVDHLSGSPAFCSRHKRLRGAEKLLVRRLWVNTYNLLHILRKFYFVGEEVKRSMKCLISGVRMRATLKFGLTGVHGAWYASERGRIRFFVNMTTVLRLSGRAGLHTATLSR